MMTQTPSQISLDGQRLLEQELQCFHEIMDRTQDIIEEADTLSLKSILELLDVREHWITEIKRLEDARSDMNIPRSQWKRNELMEEISQLAKSLVVTDAKLLDILQIRKMNTVKEMGKMADNRGKATNAMQSGARTPIVDTRSV